MDVRERLAGNLYRSALDVAPAPVVVARLSHPGGVTWDLGGGLMRITTGGTEVTTLTADGTLRDLLNDLELFGVEASFVDPAMLAVPARALLEGYGSSASSEDDGLRLFTTTLWALLDAYGSALDDADANLVAALDQLYMNTADGELLDVWGGYFGVPRLDGEADDHFYPRIVGETLRPRVNRYAIEQAITDETGFLVSLREPHREIFRLSVSPLSGGHHLQDGHFFTWNVFQPIYHSSLTLPERNRVLEIIERNRPAGCMIVGGDVQPPTGYVAGHFGTAVARSVTLTNSFGVLDFEPGKLSSTLFLSNYRERPNSEFHWTTHGTVVVGEATDAPLDLFNQRGWTGAWDGEHWNHPSVFAVVTEQPA